MTFYAYRVIATMGVRLRLFIQGGMTCNFGDAAGFQAPAIQAEERHRKFEKPQPIANCRTADRDQFLFQRWSQGGGLLAWTVPHKTAYDVRRNAKPIANAVAP